jgi:hypothetical protein
MLGLDDDFDAFQSLFAWRNPSGITASLSSRKPNCTNSTNQYQYNCASVEKPPANVPFAFETPISVNRNRPQTLALHCILVLGAGNHYG